MRVTVLAKPGASCDRVEPRPDGTFIVRVRAVAEKGRANDAIEELLAAHFHKPRRGVRVITPHGKRKIVEISG